MLLNVLSKTKNSFDAIACAQIYNAKSMLTISINKKNEDIIYRRAAFNTALQ